MENRSSLYLLICLFLSISVRSMPHVKVFHMVLNYWGDSFRGYQSCGDHLICEWTYAEHLKALKHELENTTTVNNVITLSLYNIHSWWEKTREHAPAICELHTNLTMAESEESHQRFHGLFEPSFKNFDGSSTTHPTSSVQRVYKDAYLNENDFVPMRPFSTLIPAAAYVASDCHKRDNANANRDGIVQSFRQLGFRVDGLGKCMHSIGQGGLALPTAPEARYNLTIKREVVSNYMFYFAFENSIEPGYVTEKPFDGLLSGVVPIYLGDASRLKALLPHPDAVIFIEDFANISALVAYLSVLQKNESAYEVHRSWRANYSSRPHAASVPALATPWQCKICEWAVETAPLHHKRTRLCKGHMSAEAETKVAVPSEYEGRAIRGSKRTVYFVQNGELHVIPDIHTFNALNIDLANIAVLSDSDIRGFPIGSPMPKRPAAR